MLNLFQHPFLRMHSFSETAVRLHSCKPRIRHFVHRRHVEPGVSPMAASQWRREGLHVQVSGASPRSIWTDRNDARSDLKRETAQEMAPSVENQSDREW